MSQRLATFLAVLRVELRGVLPLGVGVAACALIALGYVRMSLGLYAPLGSDERAGLLAAAVVLCGVPIIAAAFESADAASFRRALRSLPTGDAFLARLGAALLAVGLTAAVLAGGDAAIALWAPIGETSATSMTLADPAFGWAAFALAVLSWLTTLYLAAFLQHALGATLLGLGAAVAPIPLVMMTSAGTLSFHGMDAFFRELGWIGFGVVLACGVWSCVTMAPLRGPRARSIVRRIPRAALGPLLLLSIPVAGFASRTLLAPEPTWDDPFAQLSGVELDPSGERVAITLYHREDRTRLHSFWVIDLEDGTRTQIPHPVDGASALLRPALDLAAWTPDGDGLAFIRWRQDRKAGADFRTYSFDEGWKPWTGYLEWRADANEGGWEDRRGSDDEGEFRRLTSMINPAVEPVELSTMTIQYPEGLRTVAVGVSRDGEFVRCDSRTGEVTGLGIEASEAMCHFRVSPRLRWIVWYDKNREPWLVEVATGETTKVEWNTGWLTDRDRPLTHWPAKRQRALAIAGPDGEQETIELPDARVVRDLGEGRWLVRSLDEGLTVIEDDGRVLLTLREDAAPAEVDQ